VGVGRGGRGDPPPAEWGPPPGPGAPIIGLPPFPPGDFFAPEAWGLPPAPPASAAAPPPGVAAAGTGAQAVAQAAVGWLLPPPAPAPAAAPVGPPPSGAPAAQEEGVGEEAPMEPGAAWSLLEQPPAPPPSGPPSPPSPTSPDRSRSRSRAAAPASGSGGARPRSPPGSPPRRQPGVELVDLGASGTEEEAGAAPAAQPTAAPRPARPPLAPAPSVAPRLRDAPPLEEVVAGGARSRGRRGGSRGAGSGQDVAVLQRRAVYALRYGRWAPAGRWVALEDLARDLGATPAALRETIALAGGRLELGEPPGGAPSIRARAASRTDEARAARRAERQQRR